MKKILLVLLIAATCATAQEQILKTELQLGYGKFTAPIVGNEVKNRIDHFIPGGSSGDTKATSHGAFQAGLYVKFLKITVGVVGAYEKINVTENHSGGSLSTKNNYLTVMGRLKLNYFDALLVHLYGGIAGGISNVTTTVTGASGSDAVQRGNKSKATKIAYQVTPIGISIGKKFGVFAEAGYGYLGIVNGGIRIAF